jgi:hypothetical protein
LVGCVKQHLLELEKHKSWKRTCAPACRSLNTGGRFQLPAEQKTCAEQIASGDLLFRAPHWRHQESRHMIAKANDNFLAALAATATATA